MATAATPTWRISGEYFENCNCDIVCPCEVSDKAPLTSQPTQGACEVAVAFHINQGSFGDVQLDGLNAVVLFRTPGVMAEGNASIGVYLDDKADPQQHEALQKIFSGAAGGPLAGLGPLVTNVLGVKTTSITFTLDGLRRSVEVPGVGKLAVHALPSFNPDDAMWTTNANPFASPVALATGDAGSAWADYGMKWDNSGKNAHFAPITWSNA